LVVHGSAENALKCMGCGGYEAESMEGLRAHYRTEWHRHNLKRKVAGLAAIGEQEFMQRVAAYVGEQGTDRHKKKEHLGKKAREKAERREKQKDSHPGAEGHAENAGGENVSSSNDSKNASTLPDFSQMTEEEFMEWRAQNAEELQDGDSFFDRHRSEGLHQNLEYMAKKFGFFIPFLDKCNNLDGMVEYIRQKLTVGCVCLWCNKSFYSLGAVRNHMVSKSHCKINFEGCEEEYQDFYDIDLSPNSLGVDEEDEDEWETDEEEEVEEEEASDSEQPSGAMVVSTQGKKAEAARMSKKHAKQVNELSISSGEDGATSKVLGHRAFQNYYRQRLRPEILGSKKSNDAHGKIVGLLTNSYQSNGIVTLYRGSSRVAKANRQMEKMELKVRDKWWVKVGVRANKFHQVRREDYHA